MADVAPEHGDVVRHERQGVVNLVGDTRDHLAERGELLHLDELALGPLALLVGLVLRFRQPLELQVALLEPAVQLAEGDRPGLVLRVQVDDVLERGEQDVE